MTMKMRQHIVVQQLCLQVHYNVYYKLQSLFDRIKPIQAPKPVITVNVRIGHQYNRLPEDIVCLGFICAALSPPYCPSSGNSH